MTSCVLCGIVTDSSKAPVVYEDDRVMAILLEEGVVSGHIRVFPKKHSQFIDEISEDLAEHLFLVANVSSSVLFEALGLGGTNIIMSNLASDDNSHMFIDVIPRRQDDGLNLQWEPKKLPEQDMIEAQNRIKDAAFMISYVAPKTKVVNLDEKKLPVMKEDKDNYLFKQLKRLP
ncbi:hypothetical protein COV93_00485 [Candidatus Woesearchaeota archaeon CG11_big_fil_rev_8_21_14_0_20_43_8]|nr:MAG: hypothetical protein COV93_00485 [Candidatus Woesearchaeota archaeon CG11_big_fil_rev_8_21_14_0_20_43_8]PIO04905.1 MAG: hypothetical protein COT47_07020 [Candidatus Woesearchaeota archaeon CG08_land_8_20_14_0_20_43_7]